MRALQPATRLPGTPNTSTPLSLKRPAQLGAHLLLVVVGYYVGARLGLGLRFHNSQIGVVWPPNALILAALILTPRKRWWSVLLAGALAHVVVMAPLFPAWRWLWQIAANAALTTVAAETVRRVAGLPLRFDNRRQILIFLGTAFVSTGLFALTLPAFVRSLFGLEPTFSPRVSLVAVMLSNAIGILLITPIVVLWAQHGFRGLKEFATRHVLEAAAIFMALLAVGTLAFGSGPEVARFPPLLLWIFPPLLWAAVRLGPLGAATSLCFVAALSAFGTARHVGPFIMATEAGQVLSLQLFWIVLWLPVMLLAAVIREREQAEDALHDLRNQLAHATRLATAGELSGAIAHELRQPLMAILANAQAGIRLLGSKPTYYPEVHEILEDIARHDKQAAAVISRMRSFLAEGESRFEPVAVETVVRDALALSRSTIELSEVEVQTQVGPCLPRVRGDPVQLLQVVLNLIVNGCESMLRVPAPERRLRLTVDRLGEAQVEVAIADCGVGLPDGNAERVFEPFFTTKPKGLGLGLAIGRSIVTAHGGRLWAENNLQRGATFHLALGAANGNGNGHYYPAPSNGNGNGSHAQ